MSDSISAQSTLAAFLAIEEELDLLRQEEDGVPVWELVRYEIYRTILVEAGLHAPRQQPVRRSISSYCRRLWMFSVSTTSRAPWRAPKDALLIIGHPRRKAENARFVDIYTDPLLELIPDGHRYAVLEKPLRAGLHRRPAATPGLLYLDAVIEAANLRRKIGRVVLSQESTAFWQEVERQLDRRLGLTINVRGPIAKALMQWKAQVPVFRWLFQRLRPRALLLVVSAGNETVVAAAKSLGIPTAELQHGSPATGKLNYDFPRNYDKRTFPDYFLSFGPLWTRNARLPLPSTRILPIGFPYMASKRPLYPGVLRKDQLLVLSQPTVAHELSSFVAALARRFAGTVPILYKVHPQEPRGWQDRYRFLEEFGVTLVPDRADLYELLAASRWQLGVYSTAIYEGLAFSCETFILDAPGAEFLQPLIDQGIARVVRSPEDVVLDEGPSPLLKIDPFTEVSRDSIADALNRIVSARRAGAPGRRLRTLSQ